MDHAAPLAAGSAPAPPPLITTARVAVLPLLSRRRSTRSISPSIIPSSPCCGAWKKAARVATTGLGHRARLAVTAWLAGERRKN
jgi:hypothetical protein